LRSCLNVDDPWTSPIFGRNKLFLAPGIPSKIERLGDLCSILGAGYESWQVHVVSGINPKMLVWKIFSGGKARSAVTRSEVSAAIRKIRLTELLPQRIMWEFCKRAEFRAASISGNAVIPNL